MRVLVLGPESRNEKVTKFLVGKGCKVKVLNDLLEIEAIFDYGPSYIISNGFAPIIREPLISHFKERIINIHPAYLPGGRGIFPNVWCFLEGTKTGVTIHLIDNGIDTGAIVARRVVAFSSEETLATAYSALLKHAEALFFEIWDDFVRGNFGFIEQEKDEVANLYHSRIASEKLIDHLPVGWDTSIRALREMGLEIEASREFFKICHQKDCQ